MTSYKKICYHIAKEFPIYEKALNLQLTTPNKAYEVIRELHFTSHATSLPSKKVSSYCWKSACKSGVGSIISQTGSTKESGRDEPTDELDEAV